MCPCPPFGVHRVLLVQRDLLAVHPGVVEGEVQPPELLDRPLDQRLGVGGPAHLGRLEDRPAPGGLDGRPDRPAPGRAPVADYQGGARPRLAQQAVYLWPPEARSLWRFSVKAAWRRVAPGLSATLAGRRGRAA